MSDVLLSVEDGVAEILLNRPERRNALSVSLLQELADVVATVAGDQTVGVIVIKGAGPAFSAGHDLSEMIDRTPDFYEGLFAACTDVMLRLQATPQPVIAQVHGMATAAGCQLVAACDLAVATDDSRFATPGVKIGLFCTTPMVPLTRAIGRKRAMHMLLTGDPIDAATAVDWGLINRAVPGEELDAAIRDLAGRILQSSREVIAIGKAAFYQQIDRSEREAYELAGEIMGDNAGHPDAQEGMGAFLDKRSPEWPSQR